MSKKYSSKKTSSLSSTLKSLDISKDALNEISFKNLDVKNITKPSSNNTYGRRNRNSNRRYGYSNMKGLGGLNTRLGQLGKLG